MADATVVSGAGATIASHLSGSLVPVTQIRGRSVSPIASGAPAVPTQVNPSVTITSIAGAALAQASQGFKQESFSITTLMGQIQGAGGAAVFTSGVAVEIAAYPGAALTSGTLASSEVSLSFTPPTFLVPIRGRRRRPHATMWRHYGKPLNVGYTVIITAGVATAYPGELGVTVDDLSGADAGSGDNGKGVFTRGATYTVTDAERTILIAAGYTVG